MSDPRSMRTEIDAVSRVERLLSLLDKMTQRDPSPALRERLSALAAQRLREDPGRVAQDVSKGRGMPVWFKPVFAALLLGATVLSGVLVVHFRAHQPISADRIAKAIRPGNSPGTNRALLRLRHLLRVGQRFIVGDLQMRRLQALDE